MNEGYVIPGRLRLELIIPSLRRDTVTPLSRYPTSESVNMYLGYTSLNVIRGTEMAQLL